MHVQPHFTIEAHVRSATLYLHGSVSVAGLLQAFRRCDALPESVWLLRVELSGAHPLDAGTLAVLTHALRRWSESRSGMTQITSRDRDGSDGLRTRLSRYGVKRTPVLQLRDRVVARS
jgi:ABC-type transporter Mla MlaB component